MKKAYIILSFLLVGISIPGVCQNNCDTLICKDGRIILAEIIGQKDGKIEYYHCKDRLKVSFVIEKEEVETIGLQKELPIQEPIDFDDPSKTRFIIWGGLTLADIWFQSGVEGESWFRLGAQVNLADEEIQAGFMFRPLLFESSGYEAFKKKRFNGEITVFIKKVSIGRLTGETSKPYWGCDFQYGQRSYTYEDTFNTIPDKVNVSDTNFAILPKIGLQFGHQQLMLDLSLPFGYNFIRHIEQRTFNSLDYSEGRISIQPSASLGFRF